MVFGYELKIPKDRVAVLIGKQGETKKELEEQTNTKITIDSGTGEVVIEGEDALKLYAAKEVITAIGRGFNPEYARLLLKQDYSLEIVNITDFAGTQKSLVRLRGRVIGQEGKSRRYIEQLTGTYMVIYGKTIGIIGEHQRVLLAKRAIEQLLKGSPHGNVFKWLELKLKTLRSREILEHNEG